MQRYPNGQWQRERPQETYKIEGAGNKDFLDKHTKNYPFVRALNYMRVWYVVDYIHRAKTLKAPTTII